MAQKQAIAKLLAGGAFDGSSSLSIKEEVTKLSPPGPAPAIVVPPKVYPGPNDGHRVPIYDLGPSTMTINEINSLSVYASEPARMAFRAPLNNERPWSPPEGYLCLYESYFTDAQLRFPIPQLIVGFCARRKIAISQLVPSAMKDLVALLILAAKNNIQLKPSLFEELTDYGRVGENGLLKCPLKGDWKIETGFKLESGAWMRRYFFVKVNDWSVYSSTAVLYTPWSTSAAFLSSKHWKIDPPTDDVKREAAVLMKQKPLKWGGVSDAACKLAFQKAGVIDSDFEVFVNPSRGNRKRKSPDPSSSSRPEARKRGVTPKVGGFSFSFQGEKALEADPKKRTELFRKSGGLDPRLPPTAELRERDSFEDIARACATISARVSRAYLEYEEAIKDGEMGSRLLSDELSLLKDELEDTKKVLDATKAESETLEKQFSLARGRAKEYEQTAERLFTENSKLQTEAARLQREVNRLVDERGLDAGVAESQRADALARAKEEGRQEIRDVGRAKLQRARACIESTRAAFAATVEYERTESVAISLRHLLDKGVPVDEEMVQWYESESERLREAANEAVVEELDPLFFNL